MHTVDDLMRLNSGLRNELRELFHSREPFGPSAARDLGRSPEIQELVFNTENQVWKEYVSGPRVIIGRKGSGKTSVLLQTRNSGEFAIIHKISTSVFIENVQRHFFDGPTDFHKVSVENVARVWERMLNVSLMLEVVSMDETYKFTRINRYLSQIGESVNGGLGSMISAFRGVGHVDNRNYIGVLINAALNLMGQFDIDYEAARQELDEYLEERAKKVVILIDSIEEYPVDDHQFSTVLKGLLRCVGSYGSKYRHVRLCLPAEVYFEIRKISTNILKDFHDSMVLHWSPMELLRLVAWRYLIFTACNDREQLADFSGIDLNDRGDVLDVVHKFLPKRIVNRSEQEEVTVVYILRHTQLLPRQIILLLNTTFSNMRPSAPRPEGSLEGDLLAAVREVEQDICGEVFGAYAFKYPFAEAVCKRVIPELPRFFSEKELEAIYRRKGRRLMEAHSHLISPDFEEFKEFLFEIGALGRVGKTTDLYADAEFEYALPGRLVASSKDQLCLHPAFSGAYETNANRTSDRFIYPHMALFETGHSKLRL